MAQNEVYLGESFMEATEECVAFSWLGNSIDDNYINLIVSLGQVVSMLMKVLPA